MAFPNDYTLNWSDPSLSGKTPIFITESTIDTTSTSLAITGRKSFDWGHLQQENYMHLLENFASTTANVPAHVTLGQTWYNSSTNRLNVYDAIGVNGWQDLARRRIDSPSQPVEAHYPGDRWYDTSNAIFKIYGSAGAWKDIQYRRIDSATTPTGTKYPGDLWYDTANGIFKVHNGLSYSNCAWNYGTNAEVASGVMTLGGPLNEVIGTNVASASTINLTTATGNIVHITGATTINSITLGNGMRRVVVFNSVPTLTHMSGNIILPGGVSITAESGDTAEFLGEGGTTRCLWYMKTSGTSVSGTVPPGTIIAYSGTNIPYGYLFVPVASTMVSSASYPNLFAAIGYTYGGAGSTFGLPWCPPGYTLSKAGATGSSLGTLAIGGHTIGENLAHTHTYTRYASKAPQSGSSTPCWYSDGTYTTSSQGTIANYAAAFTIQYLVKY